MWGAPLSPGKALTRSWSDAQATSPGARRAGDRQSNHPKEVVWLRIRGSTAILARQLVVDLQDCGPRR